ncbi:MAG: UDP-3-O-(3-hydroxymyristoyl)glucosamine N-acyltransferase [Deltaproteobacteria bacterium]|nr:UDP-3-O-(3-hydroxymyristoyl)glucosamine N-acyltransferase [Deltaproteobacteria bacterium]
MIRQPLSVSQLCQILGLEYRGSDFVIYGLCSLENPRQDSLTFNIKLTEFNSSVGNIAVISKTPLSGCTWIKSENPLVDFVRATKELLDPTYYFNDILSSANEKSPTISSEAKYNPDKVSFGPNVVVSKGVVIEDNVKIGANCFLGPNVFLGEGTVLQPNVVILRDCVIGKRCFIGAGTVIGSEGFGYVLIDGNYEKFPQLGKVIIEDDVEIGANCAIDRGALDDTVIEKGSKIDNLVQVGHNVRVGQNTIICGQVGIGGSSKIGRFCTLAGQVGVADHSIIEDKVRVGAKSGVAGRLFENSDYLGCFTAIKANTWRRFVAFLRREFKKTEKKLP